MRVIKNKVKSGRELKDIISRLRKKKLKVAFTNGCFDILHYGHVKYLEKARKSSDVLVVALNSDKSVKRIKGNRRPTSLSFFPTARSFWPIPLTISAIATGLIQPSSVP